MEGEMEEKDGGRGEMWRRRKVGGKGGIGVHERMGRRKGSQK